MSSQSWPIRSRSTNSFTAIRKAELEQAGDDRAAEIQHEEAAIGSVIGKEAAEHFPTFEGSEAGLNGGIDDQRALMRNMIRILIVFDESQ